MAKLKLPDQLKAWKVLSAVSETGSYPTYSVVRTEFDGSKTNAVMTCVTFEDEGYSSDNVDLINDEANFVKSVMKLRGVSNYLDAVVDNVPAKNKISFYLLTNDAKPLQSTAGKQYSDNEIVDFGLQISEILEKLEQNNILHGNIKPENVLINSKGRCQLGGFTAFEGTADDPSFLAPEMQQGKQPDYTTDIYSLGLIMYTMANDGKLPFEKEEGSREAAVARRATANSVPAPANGGEKLKSVIVIACQPESKNRWKNAGNLKNALAAVKAELPATAAQAPPAVIVPESTEFESNVFEEYAFDETGGNAKPAKPKEQSPVPNMAKGAALSAAANALLAQKKAEGALPKADADGKAEDVNNGVFDDYEVQTRVFNLRNQDNESKDYGDFFEEEDVSKTNAPVKDVPPVAPASDQEYFDNRSPYGEDAEPVDQEPATRNKAFIIGVVIIVIAALVALAALAVFAVQNGLLPFGKQEETRATVATTATEAPATIVPSSAATVPTTVPETTEPTEETEATEATEAPTEPETTEAPIDVVPEDVTGFYYDYATIVLKAQGFDVAIGESKTSTEYEAGFVIAMSPDSTTTAKTGSTITLTISAGPGPAGSSENSSADAQSAE